MLSNSFLTASINKSTPVVKEYPQSIRTDIEKIEKISFEAYNQDILLKFKEDPSGVLNLLEYYYYRDKYTEDDFKMIYQLVTTSLNNNKRHSILLCHIKSTSNEIEIGERMRLSLGLSCSKSVENTKDLNFDSYQVSMLILMCQYACAFNGYFYFEEFFNKLLKVRDGFYAKLWLGNFLEECVASGSSSTFNLIFDKYSNLLSDDLSEVKSVLKSSFYSGFETSIPKYYEKPYRTKKDNPSWVLDVGMEILDKLDNPLKINISNEELETIKKTISYKLPVLNDISKLPEIIKKYNEMILTQDEKRDMLNHVKDWISMNPIGGYHIIRFLERYPKEERNEIVNEMLIIMIKHSNFYSFSDLLSYYYEYVKTNYEIDVENILKKLSDEKNEIKGKYHFFKLLKDKNFTIPSKYEELIKDDGTEPRLV
jgi:hypothetical protein